LWRYIPTGPFDDRVAFEVSIASKEASEDPFWFAALDRASGRALGMLSLMRIDAPNGVIEVGGVLFGPPMQRSRASTETQYLLARYVFEALRYGRYEWKCGNRNEPSKRAALRLGFTFEGVFRQHMIVKGENRDTAWFSMLDSEWHERKSAFEAWLSDENFDEAGRQRRALSQLNGAAK
jgi:RimJ/RimL family protein N-acetyltransferase